MLLNQCKRLLALGLVLLLQAPQSYAQSEPAVAVTSDDLQVVWLAVCVILVFMMQVGFLMLESGMVRSKNTINVVMKNFTDIGLGSLGFWVFGFGLMYGVNSSGWLGTSDFLPTFADPTQNMDFVYQMMFAATAATIVSGAVAERFSFLPYVTGAFFITTIVYPVYGAWAWGGAGDQLGWLRDLGFYDMAGASVVHSIGGWSALGALMVLGPRYGRYSRKGEVHHIPGHSLPYVAMGGMLLWFGWFGFNGGSYGDDFANVGKIIVNTHLGAVGGICGTLFVLAVQRRGIYMTLTVNGALAGLVSVTGSADVISTPVAFCVAFVGGIIMVFATSLLERFKIDDVVGAIPVHAFCGAWGTLVPGLFYQGDMFNLERLVAQIIGIVVAFVWGVSASYGLFWAMNKLSKGIRVPTKFEQRGLDISEHKEIGYSEFVVTRVNAAG